MFLKISTIMKKTIFNFRPFQNNKLPYELKVVKIMLDNKKTMCYHYKNRFKPVMRE